eukprot:m.58346 g.58346  ORF g.58346 m.58346 type:complete len:105 (-) comp13519_c0_seq7:390-704(-)
MSVWDAGSMNEKKSIVVADESISAMVHVNGHLRQDSQRPHALGPRLVPFFAACHDAITAWDAHNFTEAWTLKTAFGSVHAIAVTAQHLIAGTFMTWPPARTSKS